MTEAAKLKVLIIENDPDYAKKLKSALANDGFDVMLAADGTAGVEIMANTPRGFNAVVLNNALPDMNGLDVLTVLKSPASRVTDVPVIMVANDLSAEQAEEAKSIGAHACLSDREEILPALNAALNRQK